MASSVEQFIVCVRETSEFLLSHRGELKDEAERGIALAWALTLAAIDGLLAGQAQLSASQKAYLKKTLFGGAGSFNDFQFEERHAVETLEAKRRELYQLFGNL